MTDLAGPGITGPVWVPQAPPTLERFLAPDMQPVPIIPALMAVMALCYLTGAIRLWAQHRPWSVIRTAIFLTGCFVTAYVMGAGIEGYGLRMFSVFMFQQLTLMMAVPVLFVLGSPGTLLLRSMPHRLGGGAALRLALWGLRSRIGKALLHPGFMIPLFLVTYYGIYLGPIGDTLLPSWYGHISLELVFLFSGIIFTVPVISRDPLPRRQGHLGRMLDMFVEMPLHAFFGVILMMATAPIVKFFAQTPASWNLDESHDQWLAGGLAWSYGEIPATITLMFLVFQWQKSEKEMEIKTSRDTALYGDPDLDAYNDYLAKLARQTPRR